MAKGDNSFQVGWIFWGDSNNLFLSFPESRINYTNLSDSVRISVRYKNIYLASMYWVPGIL